MVAAPAARATPGPADERQQLQHRFIGGTSAGYWVVLDSNGVVRVWRLMLYEAVAHSAPLPGFDPGKFHRLEIAVQGDTLQVAVDGVPLVFQQDNATTARASIPPAWESLPTPGRNQGTAGVAFGSNPRESAGGQEIRDIVIQPYRPLTALNKR